MSAKQSTIQFWSNIAFEYIFFTFMFILGLFIWSIGFSFFYKLDWLCPATSVQHIHIPYLTIILESIFKIRHKTKNLFSVHEFLWFTVSILLGRNKQKAKNCSFFGCFAALLWMFKHLNDKYNYEIIPIIYREN